MKIFLDADGILNVDDDKYSKIPTVWKPDGRKFDILILNSSIVPNRSLIGGKKDLDAQNILDESGTPYASVDDIYTNIKDFFVKASGDGGTTDNTTEGFFPLKTGDAFENSALQETVDEIIATKTISGTLSSFKLANHIRISSGNITAWFGNITEDTCETFAKYGLKNQSDPANQDVSGKIPFTINDYEDNLQFIEPRGEVNTGVVNYVVPSISIASNLALAGIKFKVAENLFEGDIIYYRIDDFTTGNPVYEQTFRVSAVSAKQNIPPVPSGTEIELWFLHPSEALTGGTFAACIEKGERGSGVFLQVFNSTDDVLLPYTEFRAREFSQEGVPLKKYTPQYDENNNLALKKDLYVPGNITFDGAISSTPVENLRVKDNHIRLNDGYSLLAPKASGLSAVYLPLSKTDTVTGGTFTAGVEGVSNPTVTTDSASIFLEKEYVQIVNEGNTGVYEVLSHTGSLLTIKGVGTISNVTPLVETQFNTESGVDATIQHVTITVICSSTNGEWEVAKGDNTDEIVPKKIIKYGDDISLLNNDEGFEKPAQLNARDTENRKRSNHTGEQAISTVTDLQNELDGKKDDFSENSAFNKDFGASAGTVAEGNDSRFSDARPPTSHASSHTNGTDDIQNATISQKGLMTSSKFNEVEANNSKRSYPLADENRLANTSGINTGDQDLSGLQPILSEGPFVNGDKTKLDNQSNTNTGDETTSSIKAKRPLKTVNGNSLEGSGNVDIISTPKHSRQTLTFDTTQDWNVSAGTWATLTLTANCTFDIPTNLEAGADYKLTINTSTFNITSWNTIFEWVGGNAPVLPVNSRVTILFQYDGTRLEGVMNGGFSS